MKAIKLADREPLQFLSDITDVVSLSAAEYHSRAEIHYSLQALVFHTIVFHTIDCFIQSCVTTYFFDICCWFSVLPVLTSFLVKILRVRSQHWGCRI